MQCSNEIKSHEIIRSVLCWVEVDNEVDNFSWSQGITLNKEQVGTYTTEDLCLEKKHSFI